MRQACTPADMAEQTRGFDDGLLPAVCSIFLRQQLVMDYFAAVPSCAIGCMHQPLSLQLLVWPQVKE